MLLVKLVGKKSSQGIGLSASPFDNSLIFSPLSDTAIAPWNPMEPNQQSVVAYDRDQLQFVADITTRSEPGVINNIVGLELPARNSLLGHRVALPAPPNSLLNYGVYNTREIGRTAVGTAELVLNSCSRCVCAMRRAADVHT